MSGVRRSLTGHRRIMGRLMRWLTAGLVLACLAVPAAANDRVVYYHTDIAGSPVATTDAAGEVIWRESYAPYGKRLDGQVGADNQIWFTGKREERLLDLHYYGARWYDARLGRFLSPDPVDVREADIHSFNRYAYANNNPYIYTDPDGRVPVLALIPPALSLTGKALSVAGAALTGWTAGSNAYDVYTGEKTPGAAAQDAAIDIVIATTLKGAGAGLARSADSLRAAGKGAGKEIGILRDAAKGKGNFGLGSATRAEADKLGKAWVGDGYKVAGDGKALIGKDGLKQYRPPSYKPSLGKTQANFEKRSSGQKSRRWQSNGHLDVTD